jgi:uncharacterized protein (TIGR02453 family)
MKISRVSMKNINQEVLDFLNLLEKNNNREWFQDHKKRFKLIESEVKDFYNELGLLLNTHDQIDKVKLFRIYRDVRFSKNKLPYKTNFGGAFHRLKPHLRGGYYLHIQPRNESFIGAGFWNPSKEDLYRIRKEFEMDDSEIRAVLANPELKSVWGGFTGETLKTAPKGFSKTHPAVDLLKRKQYVFVQKFTDEQVVSEDFMETVNNSFKAIRPYFDLMSAILTTDLNGESLI